MKKCSDIWLRTLSVLKSKERKTVGIEVLKFGVYSRIFPSFSWGIFGHVTHLDQSRVSENILWIINLSIIIIPQLFPYHLSDVIVKGLRITPFSYYCSIMESIMASERSYDSLPNFTAADCESWDVCNWVQSVIKDKWTIYYVLFFGRFLTHSSLMYNGQVQRCW